MKRRNVKILGLVLLMGVVALGLLAGCGGSSSTTTSVASTGTTGAPAPTGDPIVVGAIVSATGPGAALGEQERNVLGMMEELVNASGGVLGRPLKIVVEDDK